MASAFALPTCDTFRARNTDMIHDDSDVYYPCPPTIDLPPPPIVKAIDYDPAMETEVGVITVIQMQALKLGLFLARKCERASGSITTTRKRATLLTMLKVVVVLVVVYLKISSAPDAGNGHRSLSMGPLSGGDAEGGRDRATPHADKLKRACLLVRRARVGHRRTITIGLGFKY